MPAKREKIKLLEDKMASSQLWENPSKAKELGQELQALKLCVGQVEGLERRLADLEVCYELALSDVELAKEVEVEVEEVQKTLTDLELSTLLSEPYDHSNAILSIHPGAGGTESQDWAEMLFRMYLRWSEQKGYETQIADYLPGEEAGLKSGTMFIRGVNVYGYLKSEMGVHRLVRISPFDANKRRHTSFASIEVIPEIDDTIDISIREEDLQIDTYRSSGAGGQHVNKTDSAIRITHLPSGIVVTCQNERSQHANRLTAMKILKAKLFKLEREEREKELLELKGEKKDIAWGSQIRSYVFHPYNMVKDLRTRQETSNIARVMDGELDEFIKAYLIFRKTGKISEKQ